MTAPTNILRLNCRLKGTVHPRFNMNVLIQQKFCSQTLSSQKSSIYFLFSIISHQWMEFLTTSAAQHVYINLFYPQHTAEMIG